MNAVQMDARTRDFEFLAVIGRGCNNSATVTFAYHRPSGNYVAIKRINLETCELDFSMIQHEVHMHRVLSHPNILPTLNCFVHEKEVWIITPLMGFGSCYDLIHAHFNQGLPETTIAYILRDVLTALDYLNKRGIIHRSVRASHILISGTGEVRLTGLRHSFSMMETGRRARAVHDFPNNYNRCLLWASPELLEQNLAGYDTKSDIYSVGITACELANGIAPFSDIPETQMLLEKIQGVKPNLVDSNLAERNGSQEANDPPADDPLLQRTFSPHFHTFVELCLNSDPALRPTASALLQHPFFKKIKRKSQMDSLPELLQPVKPLTELHLPTDETLTDQLSQALEEASLQDNSWDF